MEMSVDGHDMDDFPLDWKDQFVIGIGAEYLATEKLRLRVGYNYGANPVSSATVMPLFPAIVEHHISGGFGYDFNSNMTIHGAIEVGLENSQKNDGHYGPFDSLSPFQGGESKLSMVTYTLGFTYRFDSPLGSANRNKFCY
jgi:long-chain fatty acid transport protein